VTEGHPDKIADQISDAILDAVLAEDPLGRVACETLVTTGLAMISGEITTKTYVDFPSIVRNTIKEIGYTRAKYGFDSETCAVVSSIDPQSPDIAQGVDTGGAGDQGLMFGFACRETPELMPLPIMLAHQLARRLSEVRRANELDFLRPDGKSQVTIEYEGKRPIRAAAIVVSTQHSPSVSHGDLTSYNFTRERIASFPAEAIRPTPLISGDDLIAAGYLPGPRFKEILSLVEDAQLEGRLQSKDSAMEYVMREFPRQAEHSPQN